MEHSKEAQEFFEFFRKVRKEIATEDGYHLPSAIMLLFDRWNKWHTDIPDLDGEYLCLIKQEQKCGTVWTYQKVIECRRNSWVLIDKEKVIGWKQLKY